MKAIGPIKSLFNITGAVYGVFKRPYLAYNSERGNTLKGLSDGLTGLYGVLVEETGNFTHKVSLY